MRTDGPLDTRAKPGGDALDRRTAALLCAGGDERIDPDDATGLNRYHAAPYPRAVVAYASSTANDISADAFAHCRDLVARGQGGYGARLDRARDVLRSAYDLPADCDIVFAPSGTDLEYVALACAAGRREGGVHNVLLGADEVGSGCIRSAHGRYFAQRTALGTATVPGIVVEGFEAVGLADIAVRDAGGAALTAGAIAAAIAAEAVRAGEDNRFPLIHTVHGSKTGLVQPDLAAIDALAAQHGKGMLFVVDACQARITTSALHAYIARGMIVFLSGSKFMGGPPFSGFAIIPRTAREGAGRLAPGLANVFARAEWPADWPGADVLPDRENPGLALRIAAALFELERFQRLPLPVIDRLIGAFTRAVRETVVAPLGIEVVAPHPPGHDDERRDNLLEMRTLITLDTTALSHARTFDAAVALHRRMALAGVRLGQPVRCVRLPDGEWGGTLRVGLSMPLIATLAALPADDAATRLASDMDRIAAAIAAG